MRALKIILTGLLAVIALTAGLVVAAIVALFGFAIFLASRLLGHSPFRFVGSRSPRKSSPMKSGDAIDVTATEVPTEPTPRLRTESEEHDRVRA